MHSSAGRVLNAQTHQLRVGDSGSEVCLRGWGRDENVAKRPKRNQAARPLPPDASCQPDDPEAPSQACYQLRPALSPGRAGWPTPPHPPPAPAARQGLLPQLPLPPCAAPLPGPAAGGRPLGTDVLPVAAAIWRGAQAAGVLGRCGVLVPARLGALPAPWQLTSVSWVAMQANGRRGWGRGLMRQAPAGPSRRQSRLTSACTPLAVIDRSSSVVQPASGSFRRAPQATLATRATWSSRPSRFLTRVRVSTTRADG